MPTPARWSGISSRRRTTRTTGTRRRPRACSTATIDGQPRKLIAQAARNGHFFLLDRTNGKALVSTDYVKTNWSLGLRREGPADSESGEDPQMDGALVSPESGWRDQLAVAELQPADRAVLRHASRAFSVYYIYDPSDNPQGWGGTDRGGYSEPMLRAIDYKTGKVRWSQPWERRHPSRPAQHGGQRAVHRRRPAASRR